MIANKHTYSLVSPSSMLWAVITMTAVALSRPIVLAWMHDPSLRCGGVSFLLWILAVGLQWRRFPSVWPKYKMSLVILASISLCLGIAGELQAMIYLAGAILLSLPIYGSRSKILCFIFMSSLWMPALAWLLYPYLANWFPWLTLSIAVILFIYSLSVAIIHYASKPSHSST
ncbi:hypothetical protein QEH52_05390 [Coraliomargarita sp. SDUM461003]|uniref:Uncharacterized protein n=2 Tax=Thalassobacterium maritimum TaxID=3041265 RepID=A0ABU1AVB6_9BACT|nr:hypothetical protein [Coraliomargarita sp. SDUM461003]